MRKEKVIWDSHDVYEIAKEVMKENPDFTKDEAFDEAFRLSEEYLGDEIENLDKQLEGEIIIIANLGLWNGSMPAIKMTGSRNLNTIVRYHSNGDDLKIYSDGYNIRAEETHHDGTNHYLFRELREGKSADALEAKIMSKQMPTATMINRYTKSILKPVAEIYGW